MHTITISLQGPVSASERVDLSDAEALPLYVKLKETLLAGEEAKRPPRRTRTRGAGVLRDEGGEAPELSGGGGGASAVDARS